MVGMLAIAAAAGWLLAFYLCAVVTRLTPRWTGDAAPWPEPGGERPALVNLVATQGRLSGASYPATILGLAAKGHLTITQRMPGQLWCDASAVAPAETGLAESERLVLADARRVADRGGAPFEAVAESCASDVRGKWDPFEEAVRAEGRQAGLTRPRLPVAVQAPLYAGAGVIGVLAFFAVDAVPHTSGVVAPLVATFFAFTIPVTIVGSLSQKDRPTGHGAAVAAWAAREAADAAAGWRHLGPAPASSPAELSALALAVAAGVPVPVPGVSPGLAAGVRPGRGTARSAQSAQTPRPAAAWSSFGGQRRLVKIGRVRAGGIHPAAWLGLVALLALLAFGTSFWPGPIGLLLPVLLAAAAAAVAVAAARGVAAWLAMPTETSFQGQVIARWIERHGNDDSDWDVPCIAVDDGERSWSFYVKDAAFGKLALGNAVTVRAAPRSGELLSLVLLPDGTDHGAAAPGRPAPDLMADEPFLRVTPGPSNPLLTAEEVTAAVGHPVGVTGFQAGIIGGLYRGEDLTVSITVAKGVLGGLSSGPARRWGRAVPGVGDEAWLINGHHTVVFRVGERTGKVTVSGAAACALPPDVLPRLATAIVDRLTGPADRQPGPADRQPSPADRRPSPADRLPGGTQSPGIWS